VETEKTEFPLQNITLDERLQLRDSCNQEFIDRYAELLSQGVRFPAIALFNVDGRHLLADGFHRYHAARAAGLESLPAEVYEGSLRDALWHAVSANNRHGLHLTNKEKRRAVEILMKDEDWSRWSDREVARRTGVSSAFVGELRATSINVYRGDDGDSLPPHLSTFTDGGTAPATRTVTRGGKTYIMNVSRIGKHRAAPPKTTGVGARSFDDLLETNDKGLLACPFCNTSAVDLVQIAEGWLAKCLTPKCAVLGPRGSDVMDAQDGWNRREGPGKYEAAVPTSN